MVKQIELTQGKVALVDDELSEWLNQWRWCYSNGYAVRRAWRDGKVRMVYMHREILNPPEGTEVDHKNRDGIDNRIENLRVATRSQNQCNTVYANKTGYKGVSFAPTNGGGYPRRKPWGAQIGVNGKRIHIGRFATAEEAAVAYDAAAREHHGEFAVLNFPEEGP